MKITKPKINPHVWGIILPGGNKSQFPNIRANLLERNVKWAEIDIGADGLLFIIEYQDRPKLPQWRGKYYFPTTPINARPKDLCGHGGYRITAAQIFDLVSHHQKHAQ